MLGKLLKYEIPALGRKLVPLYAAWAVTAVLLGVAVGSVDSKSEFFMVISALLYSGVATAVFVMGVVMVVQRYSRSLLGDEGYFAHVLPVTAEEHIASKTISAVIWVLLSFVAMAVTGLLIAISGGGIREVLQVIGEVLAALLRNTGISVWLLFLEMIILVILSMAKSILAIYAALTIGHQAKKHTSLASIGAYLAVLTLESTIGRIAVGICPRSLLTPETTGQMGVLFLGVMILTILIGGLYFYICRYMIKERLDLN